MVDAWPTAYQVGFLQEGFIADRDWGGVAINRQDWIPSANRLERGFQNGISKCQGYCNITTSQQSVPLECPFPKFHLPSASQEDLQDQQDGLTEG